MTEKWIKDNLNVVTSILDEESKAISWGNGLYTEVDEFINKFKDVDITYEDLINHENATDGWKQTFKELNEQGILN